MHRRPRKIRRTGRHTAPSQVEKVAEKAGKAAPAMAIAGVLVAAAPQAHAAEKAPAKATTVTEQQARTDALVKRAQPATRTYTVRSGDTLSAIAERYYHNPGDWTWIYDANKSKICNPNSIYVGESLTIPYSAPSGTTSYTPRHAKTTAQATVLTSAASSLSGTLGCSGLEALWEAAGGSHGEAFMAAEIAMAESGGRQYALSPTNDYGYWQINGSHGPARGHLQPDRERQGRDRHLRRRDRLEPVDHLRHRRLRGAAEPLPAPAVRRRPPMFDGMDTPDVLAWRDGHIEALDQTALPHQVRVLRITTVDELIKAITTLAVRGAPVLGAAGALGVALAVRQGDARGLGRRPAGRGGQADRRRPADRRQPAP